MRSIQRFVAVAALCALSMSLPALHMTHAEADAPYVDAVVQPPCDEAAFNAALVTVQAGAGGTITFNCGAKTIILSGAKTINKDVTINGGNSIVLSGGNATRHFVLTAGQLTLVNITLTNGKTNDVGGGAIYMFSLTSLIADNVTLQQNTSGNAAGSAILALGTAAITLNNTLVQSNTNTSYGAINSFGQVTIANSLLRGNISSLGGGAISATGKILIQNTTFSNNTGIEGGGIYYSGSAGMAIVNSTFSNHAGEAIRNTGQMQLIRSTLNNNGVGVHNRGFAQLTNVTLSRQTTGVFVRDGGFAQLNYVTFSGSAGVGVSVGPNGGTIQLRNSMIDNSSQANCDTFDGPGIVSLDNNLSSDKSCATYLNKTSDKNNVPAKLDALANNGGDTMTHLPQAGSPLIDAGVCLPFVTSQDQRGLLRPQGAACDIGAVEVQPGSVEPVLDKFVYVPLVVR